MKTISDRLKWLHSRNENQMDWLRRQLEKNYDMSRFVRENRREDDKSFKTLLENQWIKDSNSKPDIINKQISRLRNAWNSHSKKSTSFSLSTEARKQLDKIAKKENKTRKEIVETLILRTKYFDEMEMELRELTDENEALISDNHSKNLKIKDYKYLKEKLARLENKNRKSKAKTLKRKSKNKKLKPKSNIKKYR